MDHSDDTCRVMIQACIVKQKAANCWDRAACQLGNIAAIAEKI